MPSLPCQLAFVALGLLPDVLAPGSRAVNHVAVLEVVPSLAAWRFVASPVRGFGGVHAIQLGQPFSFSTKYGTRIYAVAAGEAVPDTVDATWRAAHAAGALPFTEIVSAPLGSALCSVVSTVRVIAVQGGAVQLERGTDLLLDAFGRPLGRGVSWFVPAAVLMLGSVWLGRLRCRAGGVRA